MSRLIRYGSTMPIFSAKKAKGLQTAQLFVHEKPDTASSLIVRRRPSLHRHSCRYGRPTWVVFGKPLAQNQAIQFPLAELYTEAEMIRALIWKTAWQLDEGVSTIWK
ncbi:MAG: acyl-CoA dehydrogenase family protein [Acidimicrobiales bacterium]